MLGKEDWVMPNIPTPKPQETPSDLKVREAWEALEKVLVEDRSSQNASMRIWNNREHYWKVLVPLYKHGFFSTKMAITWELFEEPGRRSDGTRWRVAGKDIFVTKTTFAQFGQIEDRFGVGNIEDKLRASSLRFLKLWKESGEKQRPTALMVAKFSIYERLDPATHKVDGPLIRKSAEIPEEDLAAAKPAIAITDQQLLKAAKSRISVNSGALLLLNGVEEEESWEGFEDIPDEWASLLFGDDED